MASEKISQMPAATAWHAADFFPFVQSLQNLSATRAVLFTAVAGDVLQFLTPNASWGYDASENFLGIVPTSKTLILRRGSADVFQLNSSGQLIVAGILEQSTYIGNTGNSYLRVRRSATVGNILVHLHVTAGATLSQTWGATLILNVDTAGTVTMDTPAGQSWTLTSQGSSFSFDGNGNLDVVCGAGLYLHFSVSLASFQMDTAGGIQLKSVDGNSVQATFVPGTSTDWAGDPPYFADAINRMAAVIAANFGAIP